MKEKWVVVLHYYGMPPCLPTPAHLFDSQSEAQNWFERNNFGGVEVTYSNLMVKEL